MKASQNLMNLLENWEAKKSKMYPDSKKLPTIGIGHLLTRSELSSGKIITSSGEKIRWSNGLTDDQIYDVLSEDLAPVTDAVSSLVKVGLKQNQFDALVSFVFNIGITAFKNSTLLKMLNTTPGFDYSFVPVQMRRWVHDGPKVVQGLINRREKEIALWNSE